MSVNFSVDDGIATYRDGDVECRYFYELPASRWDPMTKADDNPVALKAITDQFPAGPPLRRGEDGRYIARATAGQIGGPYRNTPDAIWECTLEEDGGVFRVLDDEGAKRQLPESARAKLVALVEQVR